VLAPVAVDRLAVLQRTELVPATTTVSRCRLSPPASTARGC